MQNKILPLAVLLGFTAISAACDRPQTKQDGPVQMSAKPSDSDIEDTIKSKLNADPVLKEAKLEVDADVEKNEVTLSGTVQSEEQRAKAIELAKSARPGVTVNEKIDVKPGESGATG